LLDSPISDLIVIRRPGIIDKNPTIAAKHNEL